VPHPFRFSAAMPRLTQPVSAWRAELRRIEDLGYSTVAISDHFTKGWVMEPVVAMTAAAEATRHLRVLSLVLGNDYRHPALLHKALATLDVLSGGRVEIGLGAGWPATTRPRTSRSIPPACAWTGSPRRSTYSRACSARDR
jgi:alkanesulfonate monooxygenase SsuD/methylene tetrahydromethanopterin reductase-like flavin-dependent oxidoreductase (luciferase family)